MTEMRGTTATLPAPNESTTRSAECLGALVVIGLVVLAHASRVRGVSPWDSAWAEDLGTFSAQANQLGPLRSLIEPYAGYYQLPIRVSTLPTAWIPAGWIPAYLATIATLVSAGVGWVVFRLSRTVLSTVTARVVVAVAPAIIPLAAGENVANVTNLIWLFLYAAVWALVAPSDTRVDFVLRVGIVVLAATSTLLGVAFIPLAAIITWRRSAARERVVPTVFVGLVVVHAALAFVFATPDRSGGTASLLTTVINAFAVRIVGSTVVGEQWVDDLWTDHGRVFQLAVIVIGTAVIGVGAWRSTPVARSIAIGFIACAALLTVVIFAARDLTLLDPTADVFNPNGTRYFLVPALLLVAAAATLYDHADRRGHQCGLALLCVGVIITAFGWRSAPPRPPESSWALQIRAAEQQCEDGAERVTLVAAPTPAFALTVRCHRLWADTRVRSPSTAPP